MAQPVIADRQQVRQAAMHAELYMTQLVRTWASAADYNGGGLA